MAMKLTKKQVLGAQQLINMLNNICNNAGIQDAFHLVKKDTDYAFTCVLPEFGVNLQVTKLSKESSE